MLFVRMSDFISVTGNFGTVKSWVAQAVMKDCTKVQCDSVMLKVQENLHYSARRGLRWQEVRQGREEMQPMTRLSGSRLKRKNAGMLATSEIPDVLKRFWCTWISGAPTIAATGTRNSWISSWRMDLTVRVGDMLALLAVGHGTTRVPTESHRDSCVDRSCWFYWETICLAGLKAADCDIVCRLNAFFYITSLNCSALLISLVCIKLTCCSFCQSFFHQNKVYFYCKNCVFLYLVVRSLQRGNTAQTYHHKAYSCILQCCTCA